MGIFTRRQLKHALDGEPEVLEGLKTRMADLERSFKMLQLEWADALDRLKSMMHRTIKERQLREKMAVEDGEEIEEGAPTLNATGQLDPVSERILARRNRIAGRSREV